MGFRSLSFDTHKGISKAVNADSGTELGDDSNRITGGGLSVKELEAWVWTGPS